MSHAEQALALALARELGCDNAGAAAHIAALERGDAYGELTAIRALCARPQAASRFN